MSLKGIKIATPTFDDIVPSTKKKVKLHPFKVGDEKTLLMASESKDTKMMYNALKGVIGNCVEGAEVSELASFDMEYLFIKLRSISVGEIAKIGLKCISCETSNPIDVDLTAVKVVETKGHTNIIKLMDDLIFEMKYLDPEESIDVPQDANGYIEIVAKSVYKVFYGEEVLEIGPSDVEDVIAILEQLTSTQFKPIQEFFTTQPKLIENVTFDCKHCGEKNEVALEGMASFF